jgi:DNA-binding response OmpR family regulator
VAPAKRVLVIDDDALLARLLPRTLEPLPVMVTVAGSLAEARLAIAKWGKPDLVIADLHLPNGDGRHLREDLAGVPFITISGFADEEPDLAKPFPGYLLRAKVSERLGLPVEGV